VTDPSDETLMNDIIGGSQDAFDTLVMRHTTRFYRLAYRLTGNKESAEDAVQDAFIKIWEFPERWNAEKGAKFTTWFYRIVTNLCLDNRRKLSRRPETEMDEDIYISNDNSQEETMIEAERKSAVKRSFLALPDNYKTVLGLCYYQELSAKEAAAVMGISVKAVQSLTMRAKEMLKNAIIRDTETKHHDKKHV